MAGGDQWRFRFYQMQTGLPGFTSELHLFDIPLSGVTFSTKLNNIGTMSGTIQMTDSGVQSALANQPSLDLLCDRTAVYVELNGNLVWGGIMQQAQYQSTKGQTKIQCQDWWGYFAGMRMITWNSSYTGVDQLLVAADLINIAQGNASSTSQIPNISAGYTAGGNVGVVLGPIATSALSGAVVSSQDVTVGYAQSAFKNLGQAISDIGTGANGYDWTIDVAYDTNGIPTKTFNLWYPRAGRTYQVQQASGAAVEFNMPGTSGQDYNWPSGVIQTANVLFAAGSGTGNSAISAEAASPDLLTTGWPLMENSTSFTDVIDQEQLDNIALAYLYQVQTPVRQPSVQYNPGSDSDQPLGSFAIGDDCRLIIAPDPFFQNGYDSARGNYGENWWRIIQVDTQVADDGKSNMTVSLATPPVFVNT